VSESELEFHTFGKYEVLEEIGQGAMGVVYRAHDPVLEREVAIKTISASLGKDDELRKRFRREAQAAARLNHANIITIYEYGEAHGKIYIAMELLEGTDLKELMLQGALQTFDDQLAVMEQVLDGLAFAHSKEVVHRDLKPGNIHIQPNGQIKILDFGLARLGSSEMTQAGVVMGTPNYMSPEQVLGDKIDARSDIFSIGAVFYELLSGRKPFESESMHGVLFQVVHKDAPPLKSWIGDLPPVLVQVVERCLAKEKEHRFQDAGELRDAIATIRQALAAGRGHEVALDAETGRVYYEGEEVDDHGGRSRSWPPSSSLAPRPAPPGERSDPPSTDPGAGAWVEGTVALDVGSSTPRPPSKPPSRPPVRPVPETLSGRSRTRPGPRPAPRRTSAALMSVLGVALVALAGFGAWYSGLLQIPASGSSGGGASSTRLEAVTRALVRTQVDLARSHLAGKKYREALGSAREALTLDPANAAALEVQRDAQSLLGEIDVAAEEAQSRAAGGDIEGASAALSRLLDLDPSHPVASQLSEQLNASFRSRAEQARQAMRDSRGQAERAGGRSAPEFASATRLSEAAEASLVASEFAQATRGFLEARDDFDRARRTAEPPSQETPEPVRVARGGASSPSGPERPPGTPVPQPSAVASPVTTLPPAAAVVRSALVARSTQNESGKKGPSGFEGAANPDFMGEIDFEAPGEVGAGDEYTLRVFLKNVGRKRMKLRSVRVETRTNGETRAVAAPLLADSVEEGHRTAIAELSGVWPPGVESWSLSVVVTGDQGDTVSNRLVLRTN